MPKDIITKVYTFDELNDKAKEAAREWWREGRESSDLENVIDDAARMGEMLGIEFDTRPVKLMGGDTRQDACIFWSLGYSQSDFASFDGRYRYKPDAVAAITAEVGEHDTVLVGLATRLEALQKQLGDTLTARITYHHYYGQRVECEAFGDDDVEAEISAEQEAEAKDIFADFSRWIYRNLRTEDEYQSADEQVDDNITANEYTFTESGKRFG